MSHQRHIINTSEVSSVVRELLRILIPHTVSRAVSLTDVTKLFVVYLKFTFELAVQVLHLATVVYGHVGLGT